MSIQTEIAVTQSIVYFIAAAIPIYLTFIAKTKIGKDDRHFKRLTIVFASFYGYKLLTKGVLEPLSFGILILFGSTYLINKISVHKMIDKLEPVGEGDVENANENI